MVPEASTDPIVWLQQHQLPEEKGGTYNLRMFWAGGGGGRGGGRGGGGGLTFFAIQLAAMPRLGLGMRGTDVK